MLSWTQRLGVVSGNAFEFYDIAVFAAISPYLSQILNASGIAHPNWVVWGIFALRFLIRPLGGLVVGKIADLQGRKKALIITSSLTGCATLVMSMLPVQFLGESIVVVLLFLQMVQAFSFGGEYPTIIQYLHQESAVNERARISSMIVASSIVGVIASILIITFLKLFLSSIQMQSYGWRIPLFLGAINILISFWFRWRLPLSSPQEVERQSHNFWVMGKVGLLSVTGAIIFYIQNISSGILANDFPIQPFRLVNSVLLLALILCIGWLTDKWGSPKQSLTWGASVGLFVLYPAYYLLSQHGYPAEIQWGALFVISLISALILANLATMLFQEAQGNTTSLGLGYNIALSIFGGMSPLIVQFLSDHNTSYVGIYAAAATIPALLGIYWSQGNAQLLARMPE
jgi:MHS family proline/betaine transporter-like MFS transporter